MARESSGTSWLPDESPVFAHHQAKGPWTLMFHYNAFVQYLADGGRRGDVQVGSINWVMGMARRALGRGRLGINGMVSAEPWSIRGCGYPDLLASGEICGGEKIHDRQHPHDLLMELAADYDAPLTGTIRWQVYGSIVGEPALGPVAYPHRPSALPNPLAPIAHHWLDATHITFGVVTGGIHGQRWKAEASVFNGREPDEERTNIDLKALDSTAARFSFLPTPRWALQVSAGRVIEAEAGEGSEPRTDATRVTASATYTRRWHEANVSAATVAWGRNVEDRRASNALLVEGSLTLAERHAVYGRFEVVSKSAHDLSVPAPPEAFVVRKLQGGYVRYLRPWKTLQAGLGAAASLGTVPDALQTTYGGRSNPGAALYLTLRPVALTVNSVGRQ